MEEAASCQVSLVTATAPQARHSGCSEGTGCTGGTKPEHPLLWEQGQCVLESRAALEADLVPTPLPDKTATTRQPQAAPGTVPGLAAQTRVQARTKTPTCFAPAEQE